MMSPLWSKTKKIKGTERSALSRTVNIYIINIKIILGGTKVSNFYIKKPYFVKILKKIDYG